MRIKLFTQFSLLAMLFVIAGCTTKNQYEFDMKPERITQTTPVKSLTIQKISFVSSNILSDKDFENLKKTVSEKGVYPAMTTLGYNYKEEFAKFENIKTMEPLVHSSGKVVSYVSKIDKVKDKIVSVDLDKVKEGITVTLFTTYQPDGSIKVSFEFVSNEILGMQKLSNNLELPITSENRISSSVNFKDKKGIVVSASSEPIEVLGKSVSKVEFIYMQIDN